MSWQQLWVYFKAHPHFQKDIYIQLQLPELLAGLDVKQQIMVMKGAPPFIFEINEVSNKLHLYTKLAFGHNPYKDG